MNKNAPEAILTDVQKFCVHDGPGLRTTVFFKGCPLRCIWCQNPETQSAVPELMILDGECVGCGECVRACPQQAIGPAGTDAARCTLCGACVKRCCAKARRITGRRWGLEELLAYLMQDAVFYRNTGGGVTLSGGEVLTQAAFAAALLERLAAAGVNTAIETCGYAAPHIFEAVASRADYILFDVKHADAAKHRRYTGADNVPILENLMRCGALGKHLIVRYPLMPGVNDTPQEAAAIAALARRMCTSCHFIRWGRTSGVRSEKATAVLTGRRPERTSFSRRSAPCRHTALRQMSGAAATTKPDLTDGRRRCDTDRTPEKAAV